MPLFYRWGGRRAEAESFAKGHRASRGGARVSSQGVLTPYPWRSPCFRDPLAVGIGYLARVSIVKHFAKRPIKWVLEGNYRVP